MFLILHILSSKFKERNIGKTLVDQIIGTGSLMFQATAWSTRCIWKVHKDGRVYRDPRHHFSTTIAYSKLSIIHKVVKSQSVLVAIHNLFFHQPLLSSFKMPEIGYHDNYWQPIPKFVLWYFLLLVLKLLVFNFGGFLKLLKL